MFAVLYELLEQWFSELFFGVDFELSLDGKQQREMRSSMGPAHRLRFNPKASWAYKIAPIQKLCL